MEYHILIPWSYIIALILVIVIICVIVFRVKWKKNKRANDRFQQDSTDTFTLNQTSQSSQQGATFCPNCGAPLNLGANYCSNCGQEVGER